jgi:uncharacterized protein (TIGR03435 family)
MPGRGRKRSDLIKVAGCSASSEALEDVLPFRLGLVQAPVVDKTGLTSKYTFTLTYAPLLPPSAAPRPFLQDVLSIFEALPDQLGLRLEREKASVEILVIDSVQRPSEN